MQLFLTVVALVALTHAAPTTHTLEVGSNGIVGSVDSPLVSILVNIIQDAQSPALVPEAIIEPVVEAEPVIVVDTPALAEPVIVVDTPALPPTAVIVVDSPVPEANPIDIISVSPVVVEPNPIDVISVNPGIVEPNPIDVISVSPVETNPIDVISVNPVIVNPSPVDVVPVNPVVVPEPIQVVDVTPGLASVEAEAGSSQIINVIMNFVFGSDGTVSSVDVPAQTVQQLVGVARGL